MALRVSSWAKISSRLADNVASVFPYVTIAASQTAQLLGSSGSVGDAAGLSTSRSPSAVSRLIWWSELL